MFCAGPDHITFLLSLYGDIKMKDWSLSSSTPLEGPQWNGQPTYFVYYACANDIVPWDFWIDLEVKRINLMESNTLVNLLNCQIINKFSL